MDQRERLLNPQEGLRSLVREMIKEVYTVYPAIVQSFDPLTCTCTAQIAIKFRQRDTKGNYSYVTRTKFTDVPVVFPHGGGAGGGTSFLFTFPVAQGDEALLFFSTECMRTWWQQGGIQIPSRIRFHDPSDCFLFVGPYSKPNVPTNISTNTVQLRSTDKQVYVELAGGHVINIVAPGGINITGDVALTGALTATQEVKAFTNHTVSQHIHPDPQGGNTGLPTG